MSDEIAAQREAFEKWARTNVPKVRLEWRGLLGTYAHSYAAFLFDAWLTRPFLCAAPAVKDSLTAAPAAPEGYVLVPIEPTPMMAKDAADAWLDCSDRLVLNKARAAVRAAIASYKGGRK